MKKRELIVVFLCLLLLSNVATYMVARFLFSPPSQAVEISAEVEKERLFQEIWNILDDQYFRPLDDEEMMQGAIEGMLRSLDDPYTVYMDPESLEEMIIQTTGSFSGIGVEITEDEDAILVLRVINDSPAQEAGLLKGDRIVEVEGSSMRGVALDEAATMLRGPSGTTVEVAIQRAGERELLEIEITREDIEIETVSSRWLEEGLGYIQVTNFDSNTAEDFRETLTSMEENDLEGLILDLRNNPGGLFDEAIQVGEMIVPAGEITRVVDRDGEILQSHSSEAEPGDYPMVVLVNEYSASAAEIIAGALQDHKRAFLVGVPTFGKASVQYLQNLSDGGALRYTIALYQTPGGQELHEKGLSPDLEIELPDEYYLQHRTIPLDLEAQETGDRVIMVQEMLKFLGYSLELTGVFDQQTMAALEEFQENRGLDSTGTMDASTRERLRSALSDKAEEVDKQLLEAVELIKNEGANR